MKKKVYVVLGALALVVALAVGVGACMIIPSMPGTYEVMVPMPDGVKLYTCGTLPRGGGKCPVAPPQNPQTKGRALFDFEVAK